MSLTLSPSDVKNCIVYSIYPKTITPKEVEECRCTVANLWLTSKKLGEELKPACQKQMTILSDIKKWIDQQVVLLQKKYCVYNVDYQNTQPSIRTIWLEKDPTLGMNIQLPGTHPFLIDALASGCKLPALQKTHTTYTLEIQKDILKIVQFFPESLNSRMGHMRCRYLMPPLAIACFNQNIPVHVIEYLLKNGANPNAVYSGASGGVTILEDLQENSPEQFKDLELLLLKYGANPV